MRHLKTSLAALSLLLLSLCALAAPVTYPGPTVYDDTGAKVAPTSITVASVTDLDGTAISSPSAVAHTAGSNSSVVYDAAAKGEAWITLMPVLSGHTFTLNPPVIFCSSDPQTLAALPANLFASTYITIPGSHTTTGTGETLSYKQWQALVGSWSVGDNGNTAPVKSGTATVTYYLAGAPKVSGNVTDVATVSYDANGSPTGRVDLVAQPFPTF